MHSKYTVNKRILLFSLSLIVLCEPVTISFSYFDIVFKMGKILVFLYCLFLLFYKGQYNKCSHAFKILLIYELVLLLSTIINGTSLYHWIYYGLTFVCAMFLTEKYIEKYGGRAVKAIIIVYTFYLFINVISKFGDFVYVKSGVMYYFLGLRTRVTDTVMVLAVALASHYVDKKKDYWFFLGIIAIAISAIVFNVSTLFIGIIIFALFLALYRNKNFRKLVANRFLIVLIGFLIVGVLGFGVQRYFGELFAFLGKGTDLNYRQYIWMSAISKIHESPISILIGHGVTELGEWAFFEGRKWQAHDQYLQVTLDGGYLALVLFVLFLLHSTKSVFRNRSRRNCYLIISLFVSYVVMMITEIYSYYPQFFITMAIINHIQSCDNGGFHKMFGEKNDIDNHTNV